MVHLVDHDAQVRRSVSQLLATHAIEVVGFTSAQDYLESRDADTAACIVLELQLPDVGGLDLQRQISRETGPPIVFISGHGDIPSTVRAMKGGAVEFLTKPLDPTALMAAIAVAFDQDILRRERNMLLAVMRRRFNRLTPREREVFALIVAGLRNKQAAWMLGISEVTLQVHRGQIMRKMSAGSFAELVRMAATLGIAPPKLPGVAESTAAAAPSLAEL